MEDVKTESKTKKKRTPYTAREKCKAVLSIWTEKRKPAEVCRELDVKWAVLSHWQNRALEGMLQALEPRVNLDRGPALSPRLQTLLEKRNGEAADNKVKTDKLEARLSRLQDTRKEKTIQNQKK